MVLVRTTGQCNDRRVDWETDNEPTRICVSYVPQWRNGKRTKLKTLHLKRFVGSNPT